jgi:hypothetical protein
MTKPWQQFDADGVAAVGGYLGVYELGSASGEVTCIGYAGARSQFGLHGELEAKLGTAASFRYEITMSYLTRYHELLMVHLHDHGRLPAGNDDDVDRLGRLSPA